MLRAETWGIRALWITVSIACGLLAAGGCPASTDLTNNLPPAATLSDDAAASDDPLTAEDASAITIRATPVTIFLVVHGGDGTPAQFGVITPPQVGSIGAIETVNDTTAQVVFTPPPGFTGDVQLSYQASNQTEVSNLATCAIEVQPAGEVAVEPVAGFSSTALVGASFTISTRTYAISNSTDKDTIWAAWGDQDWLTVAPTSGMLTPGAAQAITVTINSQAAALPTGNYSGSVTFTASGTGMTTTRLVTLVINVAGALTVAPTDGMDVTVDPDGVATGFKSYTLTNGGIDPISWSANASANWLSVSPSNGSLTPGASATVHASVDPNAVDEGSHEATLTFVTSAQQGIVLPVGLVVASPRGKLQVSPLTHLTSAGMQGGPFSPATAAYTLTNTANGSVSWKATRTMSFVSLNGQPSASGILGAGAHTTITVAINDNAKFLTQGTYVDTVSMANMTTGNGDATRGVTLQVNPSVLSISGTILDGSGAAVAGVVLNGLPGTPATDSAGHYSAGVNPGWSGTATPSKAGVTFTPANRTYSNVTAPMTGQNYTAASAGTVTISGRAADPSGYAIAGVTIGGLPGSPVTNATGNYAATVSRGWSGTATPSKAGYTFMPANRTFNNVTSGQTNQDFIGTLQSFTISGRATDSGGTGIAGVAIGGLPANPVTDSSGNYSITVTYGWSGTATPAKAGYAFSPASRSFSNVTGNQVSQNYVGTPSNCVTSSPTWQNTSFTAQSGTFTAEFDAIPGTAPMDGVMALSAAAGAGYSDYAVIVRFNGSGQIDVRDGATYRADTPITYASSTNYHFRLVISVSSHTYSAYVTPAAQGEQTLGVNLSFRTEQLAVAQLANWGLLADAPATHQVCNFTVTTPPALSVTPTTNLSSGGVTGGPFSPSSQQYTLTNAGSSALNWTAVKTQSWVTLSSTGGTINGGGSTTVTVSINSNANGLSAGTYNDTVTFTNTSNGFGNTSRGATLTVTPAGQGLTPMARWDVVPYQRISAGETLNCGVVAFSKLGIQKVRFSINGGAPVDVSSMSLNSQSNVWEYWTPVAASSFTTDGQITVAATAYGNDGGTRALETITLTVNGHSTKPQPKAWVDAASGNDSTAVVNDQAHPYRTVGKALKGIADYMQGLGYGHYADGGLVYLKEGTHVYGQENIWSNGPATQNEWVTVTTAPGAAKANTILQGSGAIFDVKHMHVKGITITQPAGGSEPVACSGSFGPTAYAWLDDCACTGGGRWTLSSRIISPNYGSIYYTGSILTACYQPTLNGKLCRGLTIQHIGADAFQNVPVVISCTVDDIDPGTTGEHADCWQHYGGAGDDNTIVYGLRGTNLHYQPIYIQGDDGGNPNPPIAQGMAFVNVYLKLTSPIVTGGGGTQWHRAVNHLLFWNCSFVDDGSADHYFAVGKDGAPQWAITNLSIKGCVFKSYLEWSTGMNLDYSSSDQNHYIVSTGTYVKTPGSNYTAGACNLDANGRPTGAPLVNRLSPLVTPADASGQQRTIPGDVGAYEQ